MPVPVPIRLTPEELEMAATVGVRCEVHSLKRGSKDKHGFQGGFGKRWAAGCLGAIGEYCVSKATGIPWDTSPERHARGDDVGPILVRTGQKGGRFLIIRPKDKDDKIHVLVTGDKDEYLVHGWIWGRDAKRKEWLTDKGLDRPEAYFVPSSELRDMRDLKGALECQRTGSSLVTSSR